MQGHGLRHRQHDHMRVSLSILLAAGMEPVAAVAVGMELVGMELVAGLELGAAAGGDKSRMTYTEAARGAVQ